jgi:MurNAc alpha-1-phosphate uridylyltransferase
MKALIFAAGLGERMRPLTDTTPKPLLQAGGKPLIVWHLEKLAAIGVRDVVVNTSWLADQFPKCLGDGSQWGLRIAYSFEGEIPLETGGGMHHALPLLCDGPDSAQAFIAVNGDIWTDYDFARLPSEPTGDAHLVLTENPVHNRQGDFALSADGQVHGEGEGAPRLTFTGIGVYRGALFDDWRAIIGNAPGTERTPPRFKLVPLLREAMTRSHVGGECHRSRWTDVGTPERLRQLDAELRSQLID